MASVGLICVFSGDVYRRHARRLMASAADHFKPSKDVNLRILPGREGDWPVGTMYRPHVVLEHAESGELDFDYLFRIDADMLVVGSVGPEILGDGITATLHPGYVGMHPDALPYERRKESVCHVAQGQGKAYYCGGFIGGRRDAFLRMEEAVALSIDRDVAQGITPCWHDESSANRYLVHNEPAVVLDPRYCCPENASWYQAAVWNEDYAADAKIVALDKSEDERQGR